MSTTVEQIEDREFTYCSAFYPERIGVLDGPEPHEHYLVMTADRTAALNRAWSYAYRTWGEPKHVNIYPRTYVRKARALAAAGLHD